MRQIFIPVAVEKGKEISFSKKRRGKRYVKRKWYFAFRPYNVKHIITEGIIFYNGSFRFWF